MEPKQKIYNITEWVDIDTGEMLKGGVLKTKKYRKIQINIKYENSGNYTIRRTTIECRHNGQYEFEWGTNGI